MGIIWDNNKLTETMQTIYWSNGSAPDIRNPVSTADRIKKGLNYTLMMFTCAAYFSIAKQ